MPGIQDQAIEGGDFEEISAQIEDDVRELFGPDARVDMYVKGDKLDVHVDPGLGGRMDDRYDEFDVNAYSDYKFTVHRR